MYARFQRGLRRCKDRLMLQGRGVGKGHTNGSASCLEASTPRSGSNDISAAINRRICQLVHPGLSLPTVQLIHC